jgi:uncharacterized membrane protein
MLQAGKRLFWLLAVALGATLGATYQRLPLIVASHFDGAGHPNGWSSRSSYALLVVAIGVLLPLGIIRLVHTLRLERLNLPARAYWMRPEHSGEANRRVRAYIWWLGSILVSTALLLHALILTAHRADPPRLPSDLFFVVVGGVLLGVGGWAAGWYRLLRPGEPR